MAAGERASGCKNCAGVFGGVLGSGEVKQGARGAGEGLSRMIGRAARDLGRASPGSGCTPSGVRSRGCTLVERGHARVRGSGAHALHVALATRTW